MKAYAYQTITDLSPHRLYRAITAVARWPEWDPDIEAIEQKGAVAAGARFVLKPKGGPRTRMQVVEAEEPGSFVDLARLPFGRMRTSHAFEVIDGKTRVRVTVEVSGLLGFLWDRLIARKQADGAAEQTRRFLAFAETLS